jgi:hypothetical protein
MEFSLGMGKQNSVEWGRRKAQGLIVLHHYPHAEGESAIPSGLLTAENIAVQKRISLDNALAVPTVDNGVTI